jgi:hypothetical protein
MVEQMELIADVVKVEVVSGVSAETIDEPPLEYWRELAESKVMEAEELLGRLEKVLALDCCTQVVRSSYQSQDFKGAPFNTLIKAKRLVNDIRNKED